MRFAPRPAARLARCLSLRLLTALAGLVIATAMPMTARAQEQVWLQIEARPTLAEATERAEAYGALFSLTHGFQLPSGWYAIAIGPYPPAEGASVLNTLKSEAMIPRDSYVTDGREYRSQFWPAPGSEADTLAGAVSDSLSAAEAPPEPLLVEPAAPDAPGIIPLTDETPSEARASEAQLSLPEKQELQTALQWFGFYQGAIDGAYGPGTRNSMAAWQDALGLEATGVLTSRQRNTLVANYHAEVAEFGFAQIEERESGINVTLPLSLVEFDRYEPPFVHFREKNGSGLSLVLISQPGDQGAFNGLYDILQTLEDMPATGERSRGNTEFTIRGTSDSRDTRAWARLERGFIKGWMLVSTPATAQRDTRIIEVLQQSFRSVGDSALDPGLVPLDEAARRGLVAGLEVQKPLHSRSGFYLDSKGLVLTTAEAVAQCGKITLDRQHEAKVSLVDEAAGIAVLTPSVALAPSAVASFQTAPDRIGAGVAVSGYSYEDRLPAPVLSWGTLEGLTGLDGEAGIKRLSIDTRSGDSGGPVFDASGSVIGMLLPAAADGQRQLPAGTGFVADAATLSALLKTKGIAVTEGADTGLLAPEPLTRRATAMTVLVSCWP